MYLKTGYYIFIYSLVLLGLTSCLNTDDDEYIVSKDSQLTIFALSSKNIPELNSTSFTIDQVNNLVYNVDSLAYGTDVNFNAMVSYWTGAGTSNFQTQIDGDTVWVTSGDSIIIGKMKWFDIYAPSGRKKTYEFKLNIHQADADSMQYKLWAENVNVLSLGNNRTIRLGENYLVITKENNDIAIYQSDNLMDWEKQNSAGLLNDALPESLLQTETGLYICSESGALYRSLDGINWNEIVVEYPVRSLLGYLGTESLNQESGLCMIIEKEQRNIFGFLAGGDSGNSVSFGNELPEGFPLGNFSVISNNSSNFSSVILIEGLTSLWATEDGFYWTKLTNASQGFPNIKGGNAFIYDNKLYYMGGKLPDGTYNEDVYTSVNSGIFWDKKDSNTHAPEQFILRENASVVLDEKETYFYIVGGDNFNVNQSGLTDVWRVGLNSKIFEN